MISKFLPFHRLFSSPALPRLSAGRGWAVYLAGLGTAYLLVYVLAPRLPAEWNVYVVTPLAWLALAGQVWGLSRLGWVNWAAPARRLLLTAALIGLLQTAAFVMAGVLTRFGYSPYAHRFVALIGNLWYLAAGLCGVEFARAGLVNRLAGKSSLLAVGLGGLLSLALLIPPGVWGSLNTPQQVLALAGGRLLPLLAEGLLAALLVWLGGPLPAIAYRAVWLLFEWLSPILPDLNWLLTAFIGTLVPLFGFFYLQNSLPAEAAAGQEAEKPAAQSTSLNSWWWVAVFLVVAFWFNAGLFGVRPYVVSGYSMKPTFVAGDLVIITRVDPAEVQVGDVIQFRRANSYIVHRVIEIREENGRRVFITQGDNNNVADEPVPQEIVEGKVIRYIPQVGWPIIGLKKVIQWIF
ncbi:MAG: signal peptidase I [Chloroflexota bacterium]